MGSFLAELRRRHLFRIGGIYVVVAWGITQVIDVLSQIYALPDWIAQPVVTVLAIGFPVTLIISWVIVGAAKAGATPIELKKATATDWALIGAFVIVIALIGYQQFASAPQQIAGVEAAREAAASPDNAVAVAAIPFANLSGDPEQESFADGITDEISSALARIPDLRVVARLSSYQFKGQNADAQTMGGVLGATHLVGGTVRRDGDRLRINANLVDVSAGAEIWSENFDRVFADVFAIQEEIATAVAGALGMQLGLAPGETLILNRIDDLDIYQDFLRARTFYRARSLNEAIALMESVVTRDPEYAPAWALLAVAYRHEANRDPDSFSGSVEEIRQVIQLAREKSAMAASEAVRYDPTHPLTIAAQAFVERQAGRLANAENLYRQALEIDPSDPDILDRFRTLLFFSGKLDESIRLGEQLLVLEPLISIYKIGTADVLLARGPDQVAIEILRTTDTDDTLFHRIRTTGLASAYAEQGQYDDAADVLLAMRSIPQLSREHVEAAARLLRSAPTPVQSPEALPVFEDGLSFVYAHVGAIERVMDNNERNLEIQGYGGFAYWSPTFAELRRTMRFKNYIRNSGLLDQWRETGFADLCRSVGDDDFECD